jgi:hypothetical protein
VFLGVNLLSREGNNQEGYRMLSPPDKQGKGAERNPSFLGTFTLMHQINSQATMEGASPFLTVSPRRALIQPSMVARLSPSVSGSHISTAFKGREPENLPSHYESMEGCPRMIRTLIRVLMLRGRCSSLFLGAP